MAANTGFKNDNLNDYHYNVDNMPPPAYNNQQYPPPPPPQPNNNPYGNGAPQFVPPPRTNNFSNIEQGQYPSGTNNGGWGDFGGLTEKNVRIRFIRKVYLIITAQLLFTFGIVCIFVFVDSVKKFATQTTGGFALYIVSYFSFFTLIIVFSFCQCCCNSGLRKVPYNYILLMAITVSLTFLLAMVSAYHKIEAVLMAIGMTLFITTGITIFSMQTKFDFTRGCVFVALCLSLALFAFGIVAALSFKYVPILQAVYGGLGAALMALFLAIDTQMLMGNKTYKFGEEDYINAALQIYLDICYMFLYLLQLFGSGNR